MSNREKVRLIALWDFSAPEGTTSGVGRGLIKRGQTFIATPTRAQQLTASGKARVIGSPPPQVRPGPERTSVVGPTEFKYDDLTAVQVLESIERGDITAVDALERERKRDKPRSTLIARLRKIASGW